MFCFGILMCLICLHVAWKGWMEYLDLSIQACKCHTQLCRVVLTVQSSCHLKSNLYFALHKNIILVEGTLQEKNTNRTKQKASVKHNNLSAARFAYLHTPLSSNTNMEWVCVRHRLRTVAVIQSFISINFLDLKPLYMTF